MKNRIELNNITKSFQQQTVLNSISLSVGEGETVGLVGPSGAGKSVLLKLMAQVTEPDSGIVNYENLDIAEVSLMFQEGAMFDSLSVYDNVAFPLVDGNVPTKYLTRAKQLSIAPGVSDILAAVGLTAAGSKISAELSGGMRRRVSLARALVNHPKIALLDDPTSGLDPVASQVIMDLIAHTQKLSGAGQLIVSQDLRRLLPAVDRLVALFEGKIIYDGPVSEQQISKIPELANFIACRYSFSGDLTNSVSQTNLDDSQPALTSAES